MISSVFALKEADNKFEYLDSTTETRLEENYYVNSTLNFLLECHDELLSYKKEYYKAVLEASYEDNPYIVNESFNTIIDKVKEIIKKIISYIESLVKRFTTHLAKFVNSEKHIIKNKNLIKKFPKDGSFNISGYEFTIDDAVPVIDTVDDIESRLHEIRSELRDIDADNVGKKIITITDFIEDFTSVNRMDDIRGQILNIDNPITESSYNNELFARFRDGKSEESTIIIKHADVNRANEDFSNYKNKIEKVKRIDRDLKTKYKSLESQINIIITSDMKIDGNSKINITLNTDKHTTDYRTTLKVKLDSLVNSIVEYIQRISTYHALAIAAKLDAYNAAAVQDRGILYKALNIVQSDVNNMTLMRENYTNFDYTREASYRSYILEKHYMNQRHKNFVNECICLSESNIQEIKLINENLKMDTKNKFKKIVDIVKNLFEKFLMKINGLVTSEGGFLKKYKDIILTKKIESEPITNMPEYEEGIKNIKSRKLKSLNFKDIVGKSEEEIQQMILPEYKPGDRKFTDFAKRFFLCDDRPNRKEVPYNSIKLPEIYAFCLQAKSTVETMKADFKTFENEVRKTESQILSSIKESTVSNEFGQEYIYSSVFESYITEADDKPSNTVKMPDGDSKTTDSGAGAKETKIDPSINRDTEAKDNKNLKDDVESEYKADDAKKQAEENNAEKEKVTKAADAYIKALRDFNLSKISSFQVIYKEYLKILRYHVRKATGSMGSTSNFSEDDIKNLKSAMKEYKDAVDKNDNDAKAKATDRIIGLYKSRSMVIDADDVAALVNKNASKL